MSLALLQGTADIAQSGFSQFFLWFTWGGMTLATVTFLILATTSGGVGLHHYVTSAVITLWAAFSYLIMATGGGISLVNVPEEGTRLFYFMRYIDWTVTTPLLLLGLVWVALGGTSGIRRAPRVVAGIIVADVLMILTGLVGGAIPGASKWFWFVISCVFFVIVLYLIWGPLRSEAQSGPTEGGQGLFFSLAAILTVLWFLYPIVWVVGTEGTAAVTAGVEVFFFAVLDILAKIAFGLILIGGIRSATGAGARG